MIRIELALASRATILNRCLIAIIAIAPALATIGCASSNGTRLQSTAPQGNVVTTYDDPANAIRLTYPGDWEETNFMRPKETILLLAPPAPRHDGLMPPAFAVVAPRSDQTVSADDLDAMQQRTIDKAKQEIGDFALLQSSPGSVGGEPARRIVYTGKKLGISIEVMYILTTHAGRPYAFSYMSSPDVFDAVRPGVETVVDSVQWISDAQR